MDNQDDTAHLVTPKNPTAPEVSHEKLLDLSIRSILIRLSVPPGTTFDAFLPAATAAEADLWTRSLERLMTIRSGWSQ